MSCSERTIKIGTLVTDSITEETVSETIDLLTSSSTPVRLTSFTDGHGSIVVRVSVTDSGYSTGKFSLGRIDGSGADGTVHDDLVLPGDGNEKIGMVWTTSGSEEGPALYHQALRTVGAHETVTYKVTLDPTA
jgi:hypothetical protein